MISQKPWKNCVSCQTDVLAVIHSLVTHRFFNYGVYFVVLVNGVILVVETALVSHASNTAINTNIYAYFSYTFIGREYTVEIGRFDQCVLDWTNQCKSCLP